MAKLVAAVVVLLLVAAAAGYYYYLSPSALFKRTTQYALDDFSKAVASKDRAKIGESLKKLLSDSANIRLQVGFSMIMQKNANNEVQEFDKPAFIAFVDNTLYSLSNYGYTAQVKHFTLSDDRKTAQVTFTSQEWAEGMSYYDGTGVNMGFNSDTTCEGKVLFEEKQVLLDNVTCRMQLHSSAQSSR